MVGQMGFVDYYIILGVTPEADTDTIRRAYIRYARLFHPDINKSAEADEMMRWINQAKEILLDNPQRREAYDRDREYFYRMMNRRAELEQQKETCADSPRLPSHSERINPPSYVISPDIFRHEPASKDTRRELQAKADAIRDKINQIQTEHDDELIRITGSRWKFITNLTNTAWIAAVLFMPAKLADMLFVFPISGRNLYVLSAGLVVAIELACLYFVSRNKTVKQKASSLIKSWFQPPYGLLTTMALAGLLLIEDFNNFVLCALALHALLIGRVFAVYQGIFMDILNAHQNAYQAKMHGLTIELLDTWEKLSGIRE